MLSSKPELSWQKRWTSRTRTIDTTGRVGRHQWVYGGTHRCIRTSDWNIWAHLLPGWFKWGYYLLPRDRISWSILTIRHWSIIIIFFSSGIISRSDGDFGLATLVGCWCTSTALKPSAASSQELPLQLWSVASTFVCLDWYTLWRFLWCRRFRSRLCRAAIFGFFTLFLFEGLVYIQYIWVFKKKKKKETITNLTAADEGRH